MHKFTYDFLKKDTITSDLFSLSNVITALKIKTDIKKEENSTLFLALESIAVKDSVRSSNAIEGIFTSAERITDIVDNNKEPLTHDEEEIAGYKDAIDYVKENYKDLDFNEETVLKLHSFLVGRHKNYKDGGTYKKRDNVVAERNADGTIKRVVYRPVTYKNTKAYMDELFLAFQVASSDYSIPALLLIPCVIVDFLAIHPFEDGNGRVSRLLTLLLLFKEGYDIGKYISFENQINEYKSAYYEALERSTSGWHLSNNTYYPFIEFTFQILYECYKEMNKRFVKTKSGKDKKNERVEAILFNSIVPLSKAEISELLPDISITTIELVLSNLLNEGKIRKIGSYKFAKYIKK